MRVILVANCAVCPQFVHTATAALCRKMDSKVISAPEDDDEWAGLEKYCPIPDWCPLTEVSLTTSLVMKN